ncbi:hypothetical protein EC973_009154, partial [Apophysomyces ossiformis]
AVEIVCGEFATLMPEWQTNAEKLSASPGSYIPVLAYILTEYNQEHEEAKQKQNAQEEQNAPKNQEAEKAKDSFKDLPRLLSLSPSPSTH